MPSDITRVGIRAHHVQIAAPGDKNTFSCRTVRVIEDVFSTIVLLHPLSGRPGAPLLRMEMDKPAWQAEKNQETPTVSIRPEDILLLKE